MSRLTKSFSRGTRPDPCFVPVHTLFAPCYESGRPAEKAHGIRILNALGSQNADVPPVIFPVTRNSGLGLGRQFYLAVLQFDGILDRLTLVLFADLVGFLADKFL